MQIYQNWYICMQYTTSGIFVCNIPHLVYLRYANHNELRDPIYMGRISPESDLYWFKLVFGSSYLPLRGYVNLSLPVSHVSECPHSRTHYFFKCVTRFLNDVPKHHFAIVYFVESNKLFEILWIW